MVPCRLPKKQFFYWKGLFRQLQASFLRGSTLTNFILSHIQILLYFSTPFNLDAIQILSQYFKQKHAGPLFYPLKNQKWKVIDDFSPWGAYITVKEEN